VAPRVSLCLIAKDEEANLPDCLASAADLVDEVIVTDTGSTDATKEVAARFGAQVFDFPWVDSFAAARNESLRHATGDWVFWLDADDRLDEDNRDKLRALLQALPAGNVAYTMRCQGTPDAGTLTGLVVAQLRLFRRHPRAAWRYRVHEQLAPALARLGAQTRDSGVLVHHAGYRDPALRRRKRGRNRRLLELDFAEHPDDPYVLFNLGAVHEEDGQPEQAVPLLRRAVERAAPGAPFAAPAGLVLSRALRGLGQPAAALAAIQTGRRLFPADPGLLFQEAVLLGEQGDPAGEENCLRALLAGPTAASAALYDPGVWAYQARHNLAVLCAGSGRPAEAEAQWRAAVAAAPGFAPGWRGLAELFLGQGRWAELEEAAARLEAGLAPPEEAVVLRARAQLARREYGPARRTLEAALARQPAALALLRPYSLALLLEGRDWGAAERALRQVLAQDPQDEPARKNLALLRQRQGRAVAP
jgi:predicted Zn-dependent protease